MMSFNEFKAHFQAHVSEFMKKDKGVIFISSVSKDELWDTYLNSFPENTRQSFNCNSCRQFIKNYGGLVKINKDSMLIDTIWDFEVPDPMLQQLVTNMSNLVSSARIRDIFVSNQPKLGTDYNYDSNKLGLRWDHFYYKLEAEEYKRASREEEIVPMQAAFRDTKTVFKRGLDKLTPYSVSCMIQLTEEGNLYRGSEFLEPVKAFQKLQEIYLSLDNEKKDNFAWLNCNLSGVGKIRNSAIGSLLIDISSGIDLETAVRKYESVVAPTNYKRPKPIVTTKMVEEAEKTIKELGYEDSLGRRFANRSDVTVNNVLYSRKTKVKLNTSVFDSIKNDLPVNPRSVTTKAQQINLQEFLSNVVPKANSIELFLEKQLENNLVSLIAAENPLAPTMFKWNNTLSWSYNNGVADSIREKVKSAGGKVDGLLRISLAWDTYSDLDLHLEQPSPGQRIYFSNKRCFRTLGELDVDQNVHPTTKTPVENIIYPHNAKLIEGRYVVKVHNFTNRELTKNYTVEIEFNGEIFTFDSTRVINPREYIDVASFTYTKKAGIVFDTSTNSQVQSNKIWEIDTNKFHKVNMITYSPNHWLEPGVGNKHIFLMLEGCTAPSANGFFNEFLKEELYRNHRKTFEVLANKLEVKNDGQEQLSGVGFSLTSQSQFYVKIDNNRIYKVCV